MWCSIPYAISHTKWVQFVVLLHLSNKGTVYTDGISISTPSSVPFTPSHWKLYKTVSLSPTTIKLTVLYLHSFTYCNVSQYIDAALCPQERQFQFLSIVHTATNHTAMFYVLWKNYKQCDIHCNVLMISIYWFFVTTCIKVVILTIL